MERREMKNGDFLQHGDVVLVRVDDIPAAAKLEREFTGIVQYGEHTGHAHRLRNPIRARRVELDSVPEVHTFPYEMYQHFEEGRRFLKVSEETEITHEEHSPITIPSGTYEVRIVREHDHFQDLVRPVVD
jgi:hypothetical protein